MELYFTIVCLQHCISLLRQWFQYDILHCDGRRGNLGCFLDSNLLRYQLGPSIHPVVKPIHSRTCIESNHHRYDVAFAYQFLDIHFYGSKQMINKSQSSVDTQNVVHGHGAVRDR